MRCDAPTKFLHAKIVYKGGFHTRPIAIQLVWRSPPRAPIAPSPPGAIRSVIRTGVIRVRCEYGAIIRPVVRIGAIIRPVKRVRAIIVRPIGIGPVGRAVIVRSIVGIAGGPPASSPAPPSPTDIRHILCEVYCLSGLGQARWGSDCHSLRQRRREHGGHEQGSGPRAGHDHFTHHKLLVGSSEQGGCRSAPPLVGVPEPC
jgi:hypothetical protein